MNVILPKKRKLQSLDCIKRLSIAAIFVYPFVVATIYGLVRFTIGWEWLLPEHDAEFYFQPEMIHRVLAVGLVLAYLIFLISMYRLSQKWNKVCICLSIFILSFVLQGLVVLLFTDTLLPQSDWLTIWKIVHGENLESNVAYYRVAPQYLCWALVMKNICHLFGDNYIYTVLLDVLLSAATAVCVFAIAEKITGRRNVATVAGLLYCLMPSRIFEHIYGGPEGISIFFNVLAVLIIIKQLKSETYNIKILFCFLFSGILMGYGSAVKPFGVITIIALFIVTLLKCRGMQTKTIAFIFIAFLLMLTGYLCMKSYETVRVEEEYGIEVDSAAPYYHYFLVGLNTEGEGQIHIGSISRTFLRTYVESGYDLEEAKVAAKEALRKDWSDNPRDVKKILFRKSIWAWQDDNIPLVYFELFSGDYDYGGGVTEENNGL